MRRDIGICVLLAAATLAVYWPVGRFAFIKFDDGGYVYENPHVRRGLTWAGAEWAFTTGAQANWHPLTWLSHMADWQLFGSWAGGHHLVNVGFHAASGILLFLILARMTKRRWPSAVAAALFLLHPLHVESVAWVAERKDVLSTLFWMLTMGAYVLYVERPSIGRYVAVFVFLALGLMAKPMLVTLPFVLLLLDYWPLGRLGGAAETGKATSGFPWRRAGRLVLEKAPLLAIAAALSVVTYVVQQRGGSMAMAEHLSFGDRLANALVAYVAYLWNMMWPSGLAVFYPYVFPIPTWQAECAAAALAIVTVLVLWQRRRRPYLAVGWFWYVGTLVPVIGLVQVGDQAMSDRYTYIPLVGIFLAITWVVADGLAKWGRRVQRLTAAVAGVVVLAACAAVSADQVRYWSDSITLFRHTLDVTANNETAHYYLGTSLAMRSRTDEAIREFRAALSLQPRDVEAHNNLAMALALQGRTEDAIREFRTALSLQPDMPEAHINLGLALAGLGQQDEAIYHYREALRFRPDSTEAHLDLGVVLAARGQKENAIREYREVLRFRPDSAEALNNLAWILATCPDPKVRDGSEAVRLAERACELTGCKAPTLLYTLAAAYAEAGRFDDAVRIAEELRRQALAAGAKAFADDVGDRLELYRSGRSYSEPPTRPQEAP